MEEEELNKRLSARIKEVFDHYEDTTADEGWALLRQKFPEQEKDRGLIWLWYSAAAIILLSIGLWFATGDQAPRKPVVINTQGAVKTRDTGRYDTAAIDLKNVQPKQVRSGINSLGGTITGNKSLNQSQHAIAKVNRLGKGSSAPVSTSGLVAVQSSKPLPEATQSDAVAEKPRVKIEEHTDAVSAGLDTFGKSAKVIAKAHIKPADTKPAVNSADALNKLFAATANAPDIKKEIKKDKKTVVGVYAATYFNYANGSENRMNLGAGFTSDFSLTNNLKLSTGLSIAQNTLNYNYKKNSGGQLYAANAVSDAFSLTSSYSPSVPESYKASLIGLDLPINIKYQFTPQKSDTYISAGLSSGTFINQTYTLAYTVARNAGESTTTNGFGDFYFAKTLNVSFGVGYPIGKKNRLVVEPFLKYPLSGLGSQQIKFGAGGVNLKLNFTETKK